MESVKQEVFTLAHLSDPHLFSSSGIRVRDLLNKRIYGYLSWHLHRRAEHRSEILTALLEDFRSANFDQTVLTGDLTHLSLPTQFREALALLKSLGSPSKVMVIPGNHDAYVATNWNHTFRLWSDYLASDEGSPVSGDGKDPRTLFPTIRTRGPIALIGICTAHPTLPLLATGTIGKAQMGRLEKMLAETGGKGLLRVLLVHHPPVPGAVSWRNRLRDQREFQTLISQHGAELILHGHTHRSLRGYLETPWGNVLSVGVPSASALGRTERRRARYHLFRLSRTGRTIQIILTVRVYSPEEQRFVNEKEQPIAIPRLPRS